VLFLNRPRCCGRLLGSTPGLPFGALQWVRHLAGLPQIWTTSPSTPPLTLASHDAFDVLADRDCMTSVKDVTAYNNPLLFEGEVS
jgi:hypothetical protein